MLLMYNMELKKGCISTCALLLLMCMYIDTTNAAASNQSNTCNSVTTLDYVTKCQSCNINFFTDCPGGEEKLTTGDGTTGCQYTWNIDIVPEAPRPGCTHTCRKNVTLEACCEGYWGTDCQECPGGASNPCSGHGNCSDSKNGSGVCTCMENWTGYACEFCLNGTICSEDLDACRNVSCPNNSYCTIVDAEPVCTCTWPYVNVNTTDNSTVKCVDITSDICAYRPFCHQNATCTAPANVTVNSIFDKCSCNEGFHGDGYQCDPSDPCQVNYGGCNKTTTLCINYEPGKSKCLCRPGYHEYIPDLGCSLKDMCPTLGATCHHKATCKTEQPLAISCKCPVGYEGDGMMCFADILQTIKDLDAGLPDPALKGQLGLIRTAMLKFYKEELTQHGPFTVFVPTNEGFRNTDTSDFQKWLEDEGRVKQVLRQHMLVGQFKMDSLVNQSLFYTLQGTAAQLLVNSRGNTFKYKILGDSKKSKIIMGDIVATNGIIHLVNRLMNNDPETQSDPQKTLLQLIQDHGQYNKLQMLLAIVGDRVSNLLVQDNITMFVTNNGVWEGLPEGSIDHLTSSEALRTLTTILENHIFEGRLEMAHLINTRRLQSKAGMMYDVTVTDTGRVQMNGAINITHGDIVGSNGLLIEVDAVMLPDGLSTLPNFCNENSYALATGPCGDCREDLSCYFPDVETNITVACQYYEYDPISKQFGKQLGCALKCNRTYSETKCCSAFYGIDCLPCPGGYENPCSGNGVCSDGFLGNGTCTCRENFGGDTCDRCSQDGYFGPDCDQKCTCLHGTCDDGLTGTGLCKKGSLCDGSYIGNNCDKHFTLCSDLSVRKLCHAHARCVATDTGNRCTCKQGYKRDGDDCVEIDPCQETYRGNCHRQATCTKVEGQPGVATCSCNHGWTGDGFYCYPATACRHHGDCSKDAVCLDTGLGQHTCQCRTAFHGNGTSCIQIDMCDNNTAGCHPKANCTAVGPGRANCSCRLEDGYSGNGFTCYGNLIMQIKDHPDLTEIAKLLGMLEGRSLDMLELMVDANYTLFVPNNQAMAAFGQKYRGNLHWFKKESIITLLNYHMLMNSMTVEMLVAMNKVTRLKTLQDGFSLHIIQEDDGKIVLVSPETGTRAVVTKKNLIATNGYINIIDNVMDPYIPTSPENYPSLETFFTQHPEYSMFAKWLKEKNLTRTLENDYNEYTLFVPNNDAVKNINVTVTTDFLLYYVVPFKLLTVAVDDRQTIPTALGSDHQLIYNILAWNKVTINNVSIEKADMFTFGGLVNGISGLLYPVLHMCNETVSWQPVLSKCSSCDLDINCPVGYKKASDTYTACTYRPFQQLAQRSVLPVLGQLHRSGWVRHTNPPSWYQQHYDQVLSGCQGLCIPSQQVVIKGCCSGYYGPQCMECPGGPQYPCNAHGTCNDKINGTGVCLCQPKFTGTSCQSCIEGWAGPHCDIDKTGCGYMNGGCDKNAECDKNVDGVITCRCNPGYRGDGFNCTGPCEINNGGCHANASCTYKVADGVYCKCNTGFLGDGKLWCNGDLLPTLATMERAALFLKSLQLASLLLDRSTNTTRYTLFVPVDDSLNNMTLAAEKLQNQIVKANSTVVLSGRGFQNMTVWSMSGYSLYIWFNEQTQQFFVNGTAVLEGNIPCTEGMIHLMATPFTPPGTAGQSEATTSTSVSPVIPVVVCVLALVTIVIVVAVVVAYKRSKFRYWKLLQRWYPQRKDSENSSLEAPLNFTDPDEDSSSGLPGNTNFGNPLYQTDDVE